MQRQPKAFEACYTSGIQLSSFGNYVNQGEWIFCFWKLVGFAKLPSVKSAVVIALIVSLFGFCTSSYGLQLDASRFTSA